MDQRGRDRRVDAAGKTKHDLVLADLRPDALDRLADVVGHVPVRTRTADFAYEALQDRPTLLRVRHLGMELNAVELARLVRHPRDRARGVAGDRLEPGRQPDDFVAVTHPDVEQPMPFAVEPVLDAFEQPRVAPRANLGVAELAHRRALDRPAELRGHRLHAVADPKHRHAKIPDHPGRPRCGRVVDRGRAAGQDDAARLELADEAVGDVVRVQLAVHVRLAHAPRDQLGVLRAEIEDQDLVVHCAARSRVGVIRSGNWGLP